MKPGDVLLIGASLLFGIMGAYGLLFWCQVLVEVTK